VSSYQGTTAIKHLVHHIIRDLPELHGREAYKCMVYTSAAAMLEENADEMYECTLAGAELLPDMVKEFNSKEGRAERQRFVRTKTLGEQEPAKKSSSKRAGAKTTSAAVKAVAGGAAVPVDFKAFDKREDVLLEAFRDSSKFSVTASRSRLAKAAERTNVNTDIQTGWHEAVEARALVALEHRQQILTQAFVRRGGSFSAFADSSFFKRKFSTLRDSMFYAMSIAHDGTCFSCR